MNQVTIFDGHVHIYPCFSPADFFDGALRNFRRAASLMGSETEDMVLCLTEGAGHHWFEEQSQRLEQAESALAIAGAPDWKLARGDDDMTLIARRGDGGTIHLLAGRQIVTAEGLEVLALGLVSPPPDGGTLDVVREQVRKTAAVEVLPWGAGKWLGRRGRIMQRLVHSAAGQGIVLGDNGNRPWFWPLPALFRAAGVRNLPGSDPLPFATEAGRAGSSGFILPQPLTGRTPLAALRQVLTLAGPRQSYGRQETLSRFLSNQLRSQLRKRRPSHDMTLPA